MTCSVVQQRPGHGANIGNSGDCKWRAGTTFDRLKGEVKDFARNRAKAGRKTLDLVFELLLSLKLLQKRVLWPEGVHQLLS